MLEVLDMVLLPSEIIHSVNAIWEQQPLKLFLMMLCDYWLHKNLLMFRW